MDIWPIRAVSVRVKTRISPLKGQTSMEANVVDSHETIKLTAVSFVGAIRAVVDAVADSSDTLVS